MFRRRQKRPAGDAAGARPKGSRNDPAGTCRRRRRATTEEPETAGDNSGSNGFNRDTSFVPLCPLLSWPASDLLAPLPRLRFWKRRCTSTVSRRPQCCVCHARFEAGVERSQDPKLLSLSEIFMLASLVVSERGPTPPTLHRRFPVRRVLEWTAEFGHSFETPVPVPQTFVSAVHVPGHLVCLRAVSQAAV